MESKKKFPLRYNAIDRELFVDSTLLCPLPAQATSVHTFFLAYEAQRRPWEVRFPFRGPKGYMRMRNLIARINRHPRLRQRLRAHANGKRNGVRLRLLPSPLKSDAK